MTNKKIILLILLLSIIAIECLSQVLIEEINNDCKALFTSNVFKDRSLTLNENICKEYKQITYDEKIIRLLKPNQHFDTVNINAYGFRGDEFKKEKSADQFRIIVVGSSHIFGLGTTDNNTIPSLLQKKFVDNGFSNVEVINAGIVAANSAQEVYLINNVLSEFNQIF